MPRAVYAGTFDPVTAGHLSVIERAARLFDRLIVLIAVNPEKVPLFSLDERLDMLRESTAHLPNVECASTQGWVVDHARACGATVLVRGVRGATDADQETALANANRQLAREVTTVFIPAHIELSEVSSTQLKALARAGADLAPWCPPAVERRLRTKVGRPQPALPREEHHAAV